jgi:hypothetical protein
VQIEIQIVDTHETLETRVVIGLQAFDHQLNWTLLVSDIVRRYTKKITASFSIFPGREHFCHMH